MVPRKEPGGFYIKGVGSCLAGFRKCVVVRVSLSVIGAWQEVNVNRGGRIGWGRAASRG